jgi:carbonic anhydrase
MRILRNCLAAAVFFVMAAAFADSAKPAAQKPDAARALALLKEGNERFAAGKPLHQSSGKERAAFAAASNQSDHAYATVLCCSDSRVPPEIIFDAGIMSLFVVRVAGNVCNADETGCIEYGAGHVKTPLIVILGHSKCGAVTAVVDGIEGHRHALEANIPPLLAPVRSAAERAAVSGARGKDLIRAATEENICEAAFNLFKRSAAVRELVSKGSVKVAGAIYDLETGKVDWLPDSKIQAALDRAAADPGRETRAFSSGH